MTAHNCNPTTCPECAPDLALLKSHPDPLAQIARPRGIPGAESLPDGWTARDVHWSERRPGREYELYDADGRFVGSYGFTRGHRDGDEGRWLANGSPCPSAEACVSHIVWQAAA